MIENISLKFGSSASSEKLILPDAPLTVFVGANHSGKSKALRELNSYCTKGIPSHGDVIIDRVDFVPFPEPEHESLLEFLTVPAPRGEIIRSEFVHVKGIHGRVQAVHRNDLRKC